MKQNDADEQFSLDLMQSESLRSRMLGIVMVAIIFIFSFSLFYNKEYINYNLYGILGVALMVVMAIRAFAVSKAIKKIYDRYKSITFPMQLINVFLEISIPSVILVFFAMQTSAYNILNAPISQLYYIMIILTIMEMDMRISAFAGILAGVEFFTITLLFIPDDKPSEELALLGNSMFYFGRSMLMIISGFIAGYLAERIKKNAIRFYKQQSEKRKVEQLFGQQLSPQIANRLIRSSSLKPEKHKACIMFLDIRDFTALTEKMTPEEIIAFQNHIFPDMFQVVNDHKGIVNQVLGDGFMATFGAPIQLANPCQEALSSSCEILTKLKEKAFQDTFPETRVGIGLHFGPVVTGNVGSELRQQFSITGQTVIIASRLEQMNKLLGTQLLISEDVKQNVLDRHDFKNMGEHEIKGLRQAVTVYTVENNLPAKKFVV